MGDTDAIGCEQAGSGGDAVDLCIVFRVLLRITLCRVPCVLSRVWPALCRSCACLPTGDARARVSHACLIKKWYNETG